MKQRVVFILLFFCSFSVLAEDTVLKLYRPYGEVIDQIAPIAKSKVSGECLGQSQLILREDAWRCQAGGKIFDPCFVKMTGNQKQVLCPQSPWVADSVVIEVSTALNTFSHSTLDMSRVFPWAIELVNGDHCQAVDPNEVYDAMPIRYRCTNDHVLIGYLQRCKPVWSMLEKTSSGVVTVDLRKAWF